MKQSVWVVMAVFLVDCGGRVDGPDFHEDGLVDAGDVDAGAVRASYDRDSRDMRLAQLEHADAAPPEDRPKLCAYRGCLDGAIWYCDSPSATACGRVMPNWQGMCCAPLDCPRVVDAPEGAGFWCCKAGSEPNAP